MKRAPNDYTERIEEYEGRYETNPEEHAQTLILVRALLPHHGFRLEIGMGAARYGGSLGVQIGLDPSHTMCRRAADRGIVTVEGIGERLPFAGETFEAVLMVNAFIALNDRPATLMEIKRVLKPASALVVGFYDAASRLGRLRRETYRERLEAAGKTMMSTEEVKAELLEAGFLPVSTAQTLFGPPDNPHLIPGWEEGHGRGGFVVIKALA